MIPARLSSSIAGLVVVALATVGFGAEPPPKPGPKDRGAICGMFVAKYPAWVASIVYADGSHRFFDGPKDLFKYLIQNPSSKEDEVAIWVTDYYTTRPLAARDALFVLGSDVLGPMGAELVPLASVEMAESFRADHGGDPPLVLDEIDEPVLRRLDEAGGSR
jgi:nitrous oxide reductase accessory protein NosL